MGLLLSTESTRQEIDQFIGNYVDTSAISEVISTYAARTNAISSNVQDIALRITGSTIGGPINLSQKIESYIDVEQMLDLANKAQLTNDLQEVLTTTLQDAISRATDGLELFSRPENQQLREQVINQIGTYVRNTVNEETIDDLMLSSSNYQKGNLVIDASQIQGPLVWTQDIQSNIMASNMASKVLDVAVRNTDVKRLANLATAEVQTENKTPITTAVEGVTTGIQGLVQGFGSKILSWVLYAAAAIILIIGIILAIALRIPMAGKVTIAIVAIVIAIALFIWGYIQSRKLATSLLPKI